MIEQGSWWRNARGMPYCVVGAEPHEVVAWSAPAPQGDPGELGIGGYCWLGEPQEFQKEFRPLNVSKEFNPFPPEMAE